MVLQKPDGKTKWDGMYVLPRVYEVLQVGNESITNIESATIELTPLQGEVPGAYIANLKFSDETRLTATTVAQSFSTCDGKKTLKIVSRFASLELHATSITNHHVDSGRFVGQVQYAYPPIAGIQSGEFSRQEK